eukprot:UN06529
MKTLITDLLDKEVVVKCMLEILCNIGSNAQNSIDITLTYKLVCLLQKQWKLVSWKPGQTEEAIGKIHTKNSITRDI